MHNVGIYLIEAPVKDFGEARKDHLPFLAASLKAKNEFLAWFLYKALVKNLPKQVALQVMQQYHTDFKFGEGRVFSTPSLCPMEVGGKHVDFHFYEMFSQFVMREDVVVTNVAQHTSLCLFVFYPDSVVRHDDFGFYSLFDKHTFITQRFSLAKPDEAPFESGFPEKVTLQLMQNATATSLTSFVMVLNRLLEASPMQVEITDDAVTYPWLVQAVELMTDANIAVSLTTHSYSWLKKPFALTLLEKCAQVSYVVKTSAQFMKYVNAVGAVTKHSGKNIPLVVSYVLGNSSLFDFTQILKLCAKMNIKLIITGNKNFVNWVPLVKVMTGIPRGLLFVDTDVQLHYWRQIKMMDLGDTIQKYNDPKFTCHVNATTNTISVSPYSSREETKAFDDTWLESFNSLKSS